MNKVFMQEYQCEHTECGHTFTVLPPYHPHEIICCPHCQRNMRAGDCRITAYSVPIVKHK